MRNKRFVLDPNIYISYFISKNQNELALLGYPKLAKFKIDIRQAVKFVTTIGTSYELEYPIKGFRGKLLQATCRVFIYENPLKSLSSADERTSPTLLFPGRLPGSHRRLYDPGQQPAGSGLWAAGPRALAWTHTHRPRLPLFSFCGRQCAGVRHAEVRKPGHKCVYAESAEADAADLRHRLPAQLVPLLSLGSRQVDPHGMGIYQRQGRTRRHSRDGRVATDRALLRPGRHHRLLRKAKGRLLSRRLYAPPLLGLVSVAGHAGRSL